MAGNFTIQSDEGEAFGGYLARPTSGQGPGLVVVQEIFGVNASLRQVCDDWAGRGYFALAPDLFWRLEPGVELSDSAKADFERAMNLRHRLSDNHAVEDLILAMTSLRSLPGCTGRVGAMGFCLGGTLAYLMATRSSADAVVGYYGVDIQKSLDEASAITRPLLLHLAGLDAYCPPAAQGAIQKRLAGIALAETYVYPEADHAFARPGGTHYHKASAELANQRTEAFLRRHLFAA